MVVATYNVDAYIDRFLASVFGQSSLLKSFEVIIVDDGSTDRSAEIVKEWQARYPKHLRYVYQENAGAAAARNTGLALARGTWVSFPDPDDFLDVDYIRKMLKETEHSQNRPLLAVFSNLLFYFEDQDSIVDNHPLNYRFRRAVTRKLSHDLEDFMQLSGATAWLHRETILKHGLEFDRKVVPSFEDAHFINRILLCAPDRTVSFVSGAKYYYRKRIEKNSKLDKAKHNSGWFIDQLKYGSLNLIIDAKKMRGYVPRHIQRTCFYDLFWKFRYLVDNSARASFLTEEERNIFLDLVSNIFGYIDPEVIAEFSLAGCTEEHKVALLAMYKGQRRDRTAVYVRNVDTSAGLVQFSYHTGGEDEFRPRNLVNGKEVRSVLPSQRRIDFMGQTYFREHFFWVPMEEGDNIAFELGGGFCRIRHGGTSLGDHADWLSLRNALRPAASMRLDSEAHSLRAHVLAMREKYQGCYVLIDRDTKADDNAEHLYRHMLATGRADNAWFILSRSSLDWDRLEAEGFKLLPFGSDEHIAAQMNAAALISSYADNYVLWPVSMKGLADLARYQFVFLQHGVLTTNISQWLNLKPIRLFITAMHAEAADIAQAAGNYKFTAREVLLSGLPRHDSLLNRSK